MLSNFIIANYVVYQTFTFSESEREICQEFNALNDKNH